MEKIPDVMDLLFRSNYPAHGIFLSPRFNHAPVSKYISYGNKSMEGEGALGLKNFVVLKAAHRHNNRNYYIANLCVFLSVWRVGGGIRVWLYSKVIKFPHCILDK